MYPFNDKPLSSGIFPYKDFPILIVDDDRGNLMAFLLNFQDTFNIITAESGMEGLLRIRNDSIAVAIVDQKMPRMTGVEFLEIVKKEKEDIIRILITAYTDTEILMDAINRGSVSYFIPKPWRPEEMEIIIKRSIEMYALSRRNKELIESLKKQNEQMEEIISQRTKEIKDINEKLKKLVITDGLTGLYNQVFIKRKLVEEVKRAKRFGHPLSILMIDVDFFKNYNDIKGHLAGDSILRQLSDIMKKELREVDFIARYGGEEFAVILPETPKFAAIMAAEKLRRRIEMDKFEGEDVQPNKKITASFGVSSFPEDGEDAGVLLEAADRSLLRAKREGRNRVASYDKDKDGVILSAILTIEEYPDNLI